MRVIKFKVLNKVSHEISRHILTLEDIFYGHYPQSWFDIFDRLIFLQFTGKFDKNGNDIYHHDTVKGTFDGEEVVGQVFFWRCGWYVRYEDLKNRKVYSLSALIDLEIIKKVGE